MNNVRSILFLLAGCLLMGGLLVMFAWHERAVASVDTRATLCTDAPEELVRVEVRVADRMPLVLARGEDGMWRLEAPFASAVEDSVVARLLDVLTLQRLGDMRTEADIAGLGESIADFGLDPARMTVSVLNVRGNRSELYFGETSASGGEVYARVAGLRNVFTVPVQARAAIAAEPDAYRRRAVLTCTREEIVGLDFRSPDRAQPVRLVRDGTGWRLTAPVTAVAEETVVADLVTRLAGARAESFVLPSTDHPPAPGEAAVPAAALAPYGLSPDTGFSVTVRTVDGATQQVVFGAPAGTNCVWALTAQGGAVVTLPVELAERCRVGVAALRDARIFPLANEASVETVSIAAEGSVYVLVRGTNDVWRLEAPVMAPADSARVGAFLGCVLRLKSEDVSDEEQAWKISLKPVGARAFPGVCVSAKAFAGSGALADLRAKKMLEMSPAAVRRLVCKPCAEPETRVVLDVARGVWQLASKAGGTPSARVLKVERIQPYLTTLAQLTAQCVETVAATPADFRRCGLDAPYLTVTADVDAADVMRWNVILGDEVPGGGRYATVGGADAVFILARETVEALSVKLAE